MDDLYRHHAPQRSQIQELHVLVWDSIYIMFQGRWRIHSDEIRPVIASGWGLDQEGPQGALWSDRKVLHVLVGVWLTWGYAFVKTHWIVHLRLVHFIVCKFHSRKKKTLQTGIDRLCLSMVWVSNSETTSFTTGLSNQEKYVSDRGGQVSQLGK